jgi:hypothetical protein
MRDKPASSDADLAELIFNSALDFYSADRLQPSAAASSRITS